MANSAGYHEDEAKLRPETQDQHRALTSMMEELEAVDWYAQRIDAATDAELQAILAHNRDEEKEHFLMLLEWLRRHDATMAAQIDQRLKHSGPIVAPGHGHAGDAAPAAASDGSLGIGSLKGGNGL
jgi:hypothetical protein